MTTDISVQRTGWDPTLQQEIVDEYEYDGGNSSSRLFERSRIKALAGGSNNCYLRNFEGRGFPFDYNNLKNVRAKSTHSERLYKNLRQFYRPVFELSQESCATSIAFFF